MRNENFDNAISRILRKDSRYPREAYNLLPAALDYTIRGRCVDRRDTKGHPPQQVTGRQLSEGLRDYVIAEYGPFAKDILNDMKITRTDDIGNIVYNLIDIGAFGKTSEDRIEDFHDVYDFHEAFVAPYLCQHE